MNEILGGVLMKKILGIFSIVVISLSLAACGSTADKKDSSSKSASSSVSSSKKATNSNKKNSSSSSSSTPAASSSSASGLDQSREVITAQETANGNKPLSFEPIQFAAQAEALLTKNYGDKGWTTAHGSVGLSSPIYFSVNSNDGQTLVVYATGQVKPMDE